MLKHVQGLVLLVAAHPLYVVVQAQEDAYSERPVIAVSSDVVQICAAITVMVPVVHVLVPLQLVLVVTVQPILDVRLQLPHVQNITKILAVDHVAQIQGLVGY